MKKVLAVVFAVLVVGMAYSANAQTPNVQVYFDPYGSVTTADCPAAPAGTVFDTVYVVANNFGMWMSAIEYSVDYGPALTWLGDIVDPLFLSLGSSPTGIALSFPLPQNAFQPFVVQSASVIWMCDGCAGWTNTPVQVLPYPSSGLVRGVRWPDNIPVNAVGMTSLICATVPVEETTWGQVKSLFND